MGVAVEANFMARTHDIPSLLRESLDGMTRNEPSGFDTELIKKFQQAWCADFSGEEAP
jgi:hypothetical protein